MNFLKKVCFMFFSISLLTLPYVSAGKNYKCAKERNELLKIYGDYQLPKSYMDYLARRVHDGFLNLDNLSDDPENTKSNVKIIKKCVLSGIAFQLDKEQINQLQQDLQAIFEKLTKSSKVFGWKSYAYFKIDSIVQKNDATLKFVSDFVIADFKYKEHVKKIAKKQKLASRNEKKYNFSYQEQENLCGDYEDISDESETEESNDEDSNDLASEESALAPDENPFALLQEESDTEDDLEISKSPLPRMCAAQNSHKNVLFYETSGSEIEVDDDDSNFFTKSDWHTPKLKRKIRNH